MSELWIGWHAVDIGAPRPSRLYDSPPSAQDPAALVTAHRRWRAAVEADQQRVEAAHARLPVWHPIAVTGSSVLPVFGGNPRAWDRLVATTMLGAAGLGVDRARVVSLVQTDTTAALRAAARPGAPVAVRSDVVSAMGSSVDLFGNLPVSDLAGLVVDVVRTGADAQGRRAAVHDKRELIEIAGLLDGRVDLVRLRDAVGVAVGNPVRSAATSLAAAERRRLEDHHSDVVTRRQVVASRLEDLHRDLEELVGFMRDAGRRPQRCGTGRFVVRTLQVEHSGGTQELELARELLTRAAARGFAAPFAGTDLLLVVGAELLAPEVLGSLTAAAGRQGKRLVLLFGRITAGALSTLGHSGSGCVVFLRLPHHDDARVAAEYLGREFTFVVNGVSIAEGDTEQWTESSNTSFSSATSRSSTSSRSVGSAGTTMNFGRSFGTTVATTLTSTDGHSSSTGGSRQLTRTASVGRVHEYVVQPEVFQQLHEDLMLVVDGRTVVLGNSDPAIFGSPAAATAALEV